MELFCPTGHGPFAEWADRCPTCGRFFVGREPIVPLATAPNELTAELWLEALRRAGIRAVVKPLGVGFGGFGTHAPLEHELSVLASDLDRARTSIDGPVPMRRRPHRVAVGSARPYRPVRRSRTRPLSA